MFNSFTFNSTQFNSVLNTLFGYKEQARDRPRMKSVLRVTPLMLDACMDTPLGLK